MNEAELQAILAHIKSYTSHDRPQLFDSGPWLDHHVQLNWQLYQRAKAARPTLTLERFLTEDRQNNPWTKG